MVIDQKWNPATYAEATYVPEMGREVLELLASVAGERVLDLGCGDGVLTESLLRSGCTVVGVDASRAMVASARDRGIDARVADAQYLPFAGEFDAVFSNAALHWITRAEAVLSGVHRALKPGGRFVAEFGGAGNVANIRAALDKALARLGIVVECPWFFPEPDPYRAMLESAGFRVVTLEHFERPVKLPGDIRQWLQTFAQHYLNAAPEEHREDVLAEAVDTLRRSNRDDAGVWFIDYTRIRFRAVKG